MQTTYDLALAPDILKVDTDKLLDEEKLIHLHPHWIIKAKNKPDNGIEVTVEDYESRKDILFTIKKTDSHPNKTEPKNSFLNFEITGWQVKKLTFWVDKNKSKVTVTWDTQEGKEQLEENILFWIRAIQEYLRMYINPNFKTLAFRALMNKVLIPMSPSQRNISIMLIKITLIEMLVIIIIVAGYVWFG